MQTYRVPVTSNGRVVIPAQLRAQLGIKDGEEITFQVSDEGDVTLSTREQAIRKIQTLFKKYAPDYTVDQFLAEKRLEAKMEDEKYI